MSDKEPADYVLQDSCDSEYWIIHIAGNYDDAVRAARKFTFNEGMCFQITRCAYVYTGGMEDGVSVRVFRYPRFKKTVAEISDQVFRFAQELANELCQKSFSIEGKYSTEYYLSENPLHKK